MKKGCCTETDPSGLRLIAIYGDLYAIERIERSLVAVANIILLTLCDGICDVINVWYIVADDPLRVAHIHPLAFFQPLPHT